MVQHVALGERLYNMTNSQQDTPNHVRSARGLLASCLFIIGTVSVALPQPALADTVTLPAAHDSWIDQNRPTQNKGTDAKLRVRSSGPIRRTLVQFNLASIPAGARITAADLQLTFVSIKTTTGLTPRTYNANRLTKPWVESTNGTLTGVTWNSANGLLWTTPGGDFVGPTASSLTPLVRNYQPTHWDVTPDIAAFVAGTLPNYG